MAAKLLERDYVGFDISAEAIELSKQRLLNPVKTHSQLLIKGEDAYKNQNADVKLLLEKLGIQPVERNKGIDGFAKYLDEIKPIPVKVQSVGESLEEAQDKLIKAAKKNGFKQMIIVSTSEDTSDVIAIGDVQLGISHKTHYKKLLKQLMSK